MTFNVETLFILQWDDQSLKRMETGFSLMANKPGHLGKDIKDGKKQGFQQLDLYILKTFVLSSLKRICSIKQKFGS